MSEILDYAKSVLQIEANELAYHAQILDAKFENALNFIYACCGKIIVTGVGKSGHVGSKIAATLASTGTPSFFLHPTEAMHGDLGMVGKNDLILAISFSGESDEIAKILPHLKRFGVKIIAMTSDENSTLAKFSDEIISLKIQKEACPLGAAPTTSTTLTLALGDALALSLMKMRKFNEVDFANFHPGGSLGRRLFLKVTDIAHKSDLPIVSKDVSLKIAIDAMTHGKMGSVLLTDTNGELVAILSDGDLRRALMNPNFDVNDLAIKYATKDPITISDENMLAYTAAKIIRERKIQLLVLTNNGRPTGAIHIHDLSNLGL
ncbi:MAG: KpsF/GutQ family sugar-phosphate isomerase [Campylobacter sp.]